MKNKFLMNLSVLLVFTTFQANAMTYCGMLGDHKIELNGEYFSTSPYYEGTNPWESNNFKPNEDCSSKLVLLSVRTNINTSEPTSGPSEETFDITISYTPRKDSQFLRRYADSLNEGNEFALIFNDMNKKVYSHLTSNKNIERNIVYFDDGLITEIFNCGFNITSKRNWCDLYFHSDGYNVKIYGNYESLNDFVNARKFAVQFINKTRINK